MDRLSKPDVYEPTIANRLFYGERVGSFLLFYSIFFAHKMILPVTDKAYETDEDGGTYEVQADP